MDSNERRGTNNYRTQEQHSKNKRKRVHHFIKEEGKIKRSKGGYKNVQDVIGNRNRPKKIQMPNKINRICYRQKCVTTKLDSR